ncbi:MAG: polyamine aminopropyltransferase [Nitrospinae bacterium]|nr:polyamine aminopropyltransferase [Nitrospinota bacterium]MBF0633357.1 polyamine aminopropyltransferase [Nitrospinota bacterium]
MAFVLLFSVFVIATCGLVYELIAGALASYLLGDSVTQFSTVIGVYLFSMGVGSYLSRHIHSNVTAVFVEVEIIIGVVGGCSAAIMFLMFESVASFRVVLYSLVFITGALVGLEIPLVMRILKSRFEFKDLISKVFTFDYVGALAASILFPLALAPTLGLVRTGFLFGMMNVAVGLWTLHLFRREVAWAWPLRSIAMMAMAGLALGFYFSGEILSFAEASSYPEKVIYSKTSQYQRMTITRGGDDVRLYLNGNLQFSSRDEYRYHEALVHPGLQAVDAPRKVLILGGGDGLAAREILRNQTVESVTLVDLDPEMTELFTDSRILTALNADSLKSSKTRVVNADAFVWLKENRDKFDFIVVDFPDPSNFSLGKLYTNTFYRLVHSALADDGVAVIQSTSPLVARKSFWCINKTLKSVGFNTIPYHAFVPSFGEWGFIIAAKRPVRLPISYPPTLRFVNEATMQSMLQFPRDMAQVETEIQKLNNQILVRYFEEEWSEYRR